MSWHLMGSYVRGVALAHIFPREKDFCTIFGSIHANDRGSGVVAMGNQCCLLFHWLRACGRGCNSGDLRPDSH